MLDPWKYMEEGHIQMVFDELEQRFGFPKRLWRTHFDAHWSRQPTEANRCGVFMRWGNEKINPVLNGILHRPAEQPTFNRLVEYVIKNSPQMKKALRRDGRR